MTQTASALSILKNTYQMACLPKMGDIKNLPILSRSEEFELAKRFHEEKDLEAAKMLLLANLRFVYYTVKGYQGYGLDQNDLVQEGTIGLMSAIKRFDPQKNIRLITFAVYWIKAQVHEFIIKNWRIVKIATTKAQRSLFFKLRSKKRTDSWLNQEEATRIAQDLNVKPEQVFEMEKRICLHDHYINSSENDEDSEEKRSSQLNNRTQMQMSVKSNLLDEIHDDQRKQILYRVMQKLDERTRSIITQRWLQDYKVTLKDLSKKYALSIERIRQIEEKGLCTLKKGLHGYL